MPIQQSEHCKRRHPQQILHWKHTIWTLTFTAASLSLYYLSLHNASAQKCCLCFNRRRGRGGYPDLFISPAAVTMLITQRQVVVRWCDYDYLFPQITIDFQNTEIGWDNNCSPPCVFTELEKENGPHGSKTLHRTDNAGKFHFRFRSCEVTVTNCT